MKEEGSEVLNSVGFLLVKLNILLLSLSVYPLMYYDFVLSFYFLNIDFEFYFPMKIT